MVINLAVELVHCGTEIDLMENPEGGVVSKRVLSLNVNGRVHGSPADGALLLDDAARRALAPTGAKAGLRRRRGAAPAPHRAGRRPAAAWPVRLLAVQVEGRRIETVRPAQGRLSAVQQAFHDTSWSACGFCNAGHGDGVEGLLRANLTPTRSRRRWPAAGAAFMPAT